MTANSIPLGLIEALASKCPHGPGMPMWAVWMTAKINKSIELRTRRDALQSHLKSLRERFEKEFADASMEIRDLQSKCDHEYTTRTPRPTAESGPGYDTCNICGKVTG
jgi:hypothetical protein